MKQRFDGDFPFGVMTSAYPYLDSNDVLREVAKIGGGGLVQEVELCALDPNGKRMKDPNDHVSAHVNTNLFNKNPKIEAQVFAEVINSLNLGVTFGNYEFIHSNDPGEDEKVLNFTMNLIDYAAALGGKDAGAYGVNVGMFFGMDRTVGIPQNLDAVTRKLIVLGNYAKDRNVVIGSENCHMPGGGSPQNDMYLPQTANRSLGSTLSNRLIIQNRLHNHGLEGVLKFTWDASHPETQHNNPIPEARLSFAKEDNYQFHIKGHKVGIQEEVIRRAYHGGPALPGAFADKGSALYNEAKMLGIPIGDNAWAQQYGMVTLAGDGNRSTPYSQIIEIARENGFNGRVTAENETDEKNSLVVAKDTGGLSRMYEACLNEIKTYLWKGDKYNGKQFKSIDVNKDGIFLPRKNFREAAKYYNIIV